MDPNTYTPRNHFPSLPTVRYILLIVLIGVLIINAAFLIKSQNKQKPGRLLDNQENKQNLGLQKGPFFCPVPIVYCQSNGNFKDSTFAVKLNPDTPLFAAFGGEIQTQRSIYQISKTENEEFNILLLRNKERGLQAVYTFEGNIVGKTQVKEGEQIATFNGKNLKFRSGDSFIFQLSKSTTDGTAPINLSPADFKK